MLPSAWSAPGPEAPPGEAREGCISPREQSQGTSESVSPSPGRGKHRHVCLLLNKCLQARRGQTPPRLRPPRSPLCAGAAARPPPRRLCVASPPTPSSVALSPKQGRGAGRGKRRGGPRGAGRTRGCTRGARAGAVTRSRGEPPTSPAQRGAGVAQTARAWLRRSPSRGGRGAARAGDARQEGRLRSGRRMAEVSGRAGGGRRARGRLTRATCSSAALCASREAELRFLSACAQSQRGDP